MRAAERAGASILFLSPIYPTRSHPGAATLGPEGFARLARRTELPVIALGGVDQSRGRTLMALGAYGWAAVAPPWVRYRSNQAVIAAAFAADCDGRTARPPWLAPGTLTSIVGTP